MVDGSGGDGAAEAEEDVPPVYEGPLSVLFELFQSPRGFAPGVTALCLTCGLDSPTPVPSPEALVTHLGQLTVPLLRRISAMLDLRVPEARWSAQVRSDSVVHPLAGKLHATLLAFSSYEEQRLLDEEGGRRRRLAKPRRQ